MAEYNFPAISAKEAKHIQSSIPGPKIKQWFGQHEKKKIISAYKRGNQRVTLNDREFWIRRAGEDLIVGPVIGFVPQCRLNLEELEHERF